MKINAAGLELIKSFESLRLDAYKDLVGVVTIGFGATGPDIVEGLKWTPEQANERLQKDLERFEEGVSDALEVDVTDNQFSALVCFAFNVGIGALRGSHLLSKVNSGDMTGAAEEFLRWDRAGGQVIPGLLRRREAERDLFLQP